MKTLILLDLTRSKDAASQLEEKAVKAEREAEELARRQSQAEEERRKAKEEAAAQKQQNEEMVTLFTALI
jgi:hypothetical protein